MSKCNYTNRLLFIKTALIAASVSLFSAAHAKQGMWIPANIKDREADMKSMGLQIPVEKLYNEDGTGMNNAVVLFGKGCTGEVISGKGLLLTNHHCGYGAVQGLSSTGNDYFANGFWAMNMQQEIPCPGLTVTFVRKMLNVTPDILYYTSDTMQPALRDTMVARHIRNVEKSLRSSTHMDVNVKPYFNGNQYWAIITETYRDIRLVGFPPNGIGFFGGDYDNWMWPRHNGDFSMFRIYAGKDNKPADFTKENKPYQSKDFFAINTKGYKEGDFTMVYGFPGTTQEYISSYQLSQIQNIIDPIRIAARTKRLDVWGKNMEQSREVFLKYTSKRAGVANGWKKWQGEVRGLEINHAADKKAAYERNFQQWTVLDTTTPFADGLLSRIQANTAAADSLIYADEYIKEAVLSIELIAQGALLDQALQSLRKGKTPATAPDEWNKISDAWTGFYKNYDASTDKQVFTALMPLFFEKAAKWVPASYDRMYRGHGSDFNKWAGDVYGLSMVADPERLTAFMNNISAADSNKITDDPSWQLYKGITNMRKTRILPQLTAYNSRMEELNRQYMKSQMNREDNKSMFPDANLTLRITYGKVDGIDPEGIAPYSYQTNLDEIIRKENPDVEEFRVPAKLKDLYQSKNYGRWKVNGTVPVAFTASNHTSGGNSGSPVLNARGELIGTNFDRVWEGTMSDLYFDPNLCRNISVDIRYTLFIVEKFGNAGWLLKEMKLVNN